MELGRLLLCFFKKNLLINTNEIEVLKNQKFLMLSKFIGFFVAFQLAPYVACQSSLGCNLGIWCIEAGQNFPQCTFSVLALLFSGNWEGAALLLLLVKITMGEGGKWHKMLSPV